MENTERLNKILDSQISKKSVNKDFDVNIGLEQNNRLLPLNEINSLVNQYQVFENERDSSQKYMFLGSIREVMSNVLINITGERSYQTVNIIANNLELSSNKSIINEDDGWFYYKTSDECKNVTFKPNWDDLGLLGTDVRDNWSLDITYPYSGTSDTIFFRANNDNNYKVYLKDGIAINDVNNVTIGGQNMTLFEIPINHGLIVGDQILITGGTSYDGIHTIFKVGDENDSNKGNTFIINVNIPNPSILNTFASFRRIVNKKLSNYILRFFKKLTQPNEIDFYYASFSKTYYGDDVICYNSNSVLDLSNYRDYLDRPITEVYLTMVKNKTGNNGFFWDKLSAGLNTSVLNANYDIRGINDSLSSVDTLGIVNSSDSIFLGDIIDYNEADLSERMLSDINHRFNSQNRNINGYYEGYYYKPHHKIVIQYYSSQIEFGDNMTINVPDYAINSDGRTKWRDILTKGYIDQLGRGVDYPFLNGINYISNNLFLSLKRQNPELNYSNHGKTPIFMGIPCNINGVPINIQNVC